MAYSSLKEFTTDIADAIREKTGGEELISPQDFASKIRALSVLGSEQDCLIYFNNTKPASIYGGTWQEIPSGTFLRAGGTSGTTKSGTATDGGSNSVTLKEANLPNMYGYLANYEEWVGLGQFTNAESSMMGAYLGKNEMTYYGTNGRGWSVAYGNEAYPAGISKGSGQSFDNQPIYKNVHIWRRIS